MKRGDHSLSSNFSVRLHHFRKIRLQQWNVEWQTWPLRNSKAKTSRQPFLNFVLLFFVYLYLINCLSILLNVCFLFFKPLLFLNSMTSSRWSLYKGVDNRGHSSHDFQNANIIIRWILRISKSVTFLYQRLICPEFRWLVRLNYLLSLWYWT